VQADAVAVRREHVGQLGFEPPVELDHVHERRPRGESLRQHPGAASDLEYDVVVR